MTRQDATRVVLTTLVVCGTLILVVLVPYLLYLLVTLTSSAA